MNGTYILALLQESMNDSDRELQIRIIKNKILEIEKRIQRKLAKIKTLGY